MKFGKIALLALSASAILGVSSIVSPVGSVFTAQETYAQQTASLEDFRQMNINTVNTIRTTNGIPALNENDTLNAYAQKRAEALAVAGDLDDHAGKDASQMAPYNANTTENLASLYQRGSETDAKSVATEISNRTVVDLWDDVGSVRYGHRKAMLDKYIDSMGVGVAMTSSGKYIVVQEFGISRSNLDAIIAQNKDDYYNHYASDFNAAELGPYAKYSWDEKTGLADVNETNSGNSNTWLLDIATLSGYHTLDVVSNNQALYSQTGKVSNRMLGNNTSWYTDKVAIDPQGNQYFRVSTDEWVKRTSDIAFH